MIFNNKDCTLARMRLLQDTASIRKTTFRGWVTREQDLRERIADKPSDGRLRRIKQRGIGIKQVADSILVSIFPIYFKLPDSKNGNFAFSPPFS